MTANLLAIDFTPYFLKGFSFIKEKNKIKILDFLELPYDKRLNVDFEVKLIELILSLEKKRGINFKLATLRIKKGSIGHQVIKKKKFPRKYFQKPISENEFKKMIESLQKELYFEVEKEILSPFNLTSINNKFLMAGAEIKEVAIDNKVVVSPIGILGKAVSLSVANIYLPNNFYKIIKKTFSKLKIKTSFESN